MLPEQIGVLLDATGVVGVGYTNTDAVSATDVQLFLEAYKVYTPVCAGTALVITGFCTEAV